MPMKPVVCHTERYGAWTDGHRFRPSLADNDASLSGTVQVAIVDRPPASGGQLLWKAGAGDWLTQQSSLQIPLHHSRNDGLEEYLARLECDLRAVREMLTRNGSVYVFADQRASAHVRLMLDGIFGRSAFLNEIIWAREAGLKPAGRFTRAHDTIFLYGRGPKAFFNAGAAGRARGRLKSHMRRSVEGGRAYYSREAGGRVYRYYEDDIVSVGDVWTDISEISARDEERTGWEGQRPEALIARMIAASSAPGDTVCDVCSGPAVTAVAAHRLGRRALLFGQSSTERLLARRRLLLGGAAGYEFINAEQSHNHPEAAAELDGRTVRLLGYGHPCTPTGANGTLLEDGLGSLEYWAAGVLHEGVFTANAWAMRTRQTPTLPRDLKAGDGQGQPCLHMVDACGEQWFFEVD